MPRPWAPAVGPVAVTQPAGGKNGPLVILLGLYALLLTVPVAELLARMGARTFAPVIVCALLTLGLLTTGRIMEFWKLPVARPYMLFYLLALVAGATGLYPSRSLGLLIPYGLRFHLLPFLCCAMVVTTRQLRRVYGWVGAGAFVLLILSLKFGEMADDRLIIKDTSLENPNDLGFAIVFAMTGLLVFRSKAARVVSLLTVPVFLLTILKTGSRADLLTLIALALMASFFAPPKWRIILMLGLPLVAGGAFLAVPAETRARLISGFGASGGAASAEVLRAGDSTAARLELQTRAIELAIRHPLFGVGVTNFEDAVEDMIEATLHTKSGWQVAHNTYLQIAAENGYPAFICYVWCLIACMKMNYRSYKSCRETPALSDAVAQSFALMMMTAMFMICTSFSNNSFDPHFTLLVGLSTANYLAIQRQLGTRQAATNAVSPPRWQTRPRPRSLAARPDNFPARISGRRPV